MSIRKRIGIVVCLGIVAVGVVIQVLFDPFSSAKHTLEVWQVRSKFPEAQAKWEAAKITDYKFEIRGYAPLACMPAAVVEVRDGAVVQVAATSVFPDDEPATVLPREQWAAPSLAGQAFLCNYAHFTMPQTFDWLSRLLEEDPGSVLQVDFDPDYGFITQMRFGTFVPQGILSPRIGDCCSWFRVEKFQVLSK